MNENSTAKPPQSVSTPVSMSPVVVVSGAPVLPVPVSATPCVVPTPLLPPVLVPAVVAAAVVPVIASLAPPAVVSSAVVGVGAPVLEVGVVSPGSPLVTVVGWLVTAVSEVVEAPVLSPQAASAAATVKNEERRGEKLMGDIVRVDYRKTDENPRDFQGQIRGIEPERGAQSRRCPRARRRGRKFVARDRAC